MNAVLRPVTRLVEFTKMAQLARLALVDAKTGLPNARALEERLQRELHAAKKQGAPLSLLFLDIDHFKRLNDTYGHAAGDVVLAEVAQLLGENVREEDFVARFGGEEFVVLLPGVDSCEALALAERLRALVAAHRFAVGEENAIGAGGETVRCTVSAGAASFPEHARDGQTLVEQADAAMYRAKQTRNAVALADGGAALATPSMPLPSERYTGAEDPGSTTPEVTPRRRPNRAALLHASGWSLAILAAHALWTSVSSLPREAWAGAALLVVLGAIAELLRVEV